MCLKLDYLCVFPFFDMCLMWLSCWCALTGKVANYAEVANCLFGSYLSTFMEMWMTQSRVSHWSVSKYAWDLCANAWIVGIPGYPTWCWVTVSWDLWNDWRIALTPCSLKVSLVRVVNGGMTGELRLLSAV